LRKKKVSQRLYYSNLIRKKVKSEDEIYISTFVSILDEYCQGKPLIDVRWIENLKLLNINYKLI